MIVDGPEPARLQQLTEDSLPDGDVTVAVAWSSLNYKDGLAVTGKGKVVQRLPMVCGIDLAGTVEASTSPDWKPGDEVIATGWGLSVTHPGGYTERQRLPSEWLLPRPDGFSLRQTMAIGTAGLTAMLCVLDLERAGLEPDQGEVLVTGAAGGVGSIAVAVLATLGYQVAASTGRPAAHDALHALGCGDHRRSRRAGRTRVPAAREGALGRRHRHGRQYDTRERAAPDPLRRCGRRLRAGWRDGPADDGPAVHPPQRAAARGRLRGVSDRETA